MAAPPPQEAHVVTTAEMHNSHIGVMEKSYFNGGENIANNQILYLLFWKTRVTLFKEYTVTQNIYA